MKFNVGREDDSTVGVSVVAHTRGSWVVVDVRQGDLVFLPRTLEGGLITAGRVEGSFVAEDARSGRSNPLFLNSSLRANLCFKKMEMLAKLAP